MKPSICSGCKKADSKLLVGKQGYYCSFMCMVYNGECDVKAPDVLTEQDTLNYRRSYEDIENHMVIGNHLWDR